jgi:hypothetical protein
MLRLIIMKMLHEFDVARVAVIGSLVPFVL